MWIQVQCIHCAEVESAEELCMMYHQNRSRSDMQSGPIQRYIAICLHWIFWLIKVIIPLFRLHWRTYVS